MEKIDQEIIAYRKQTRALHELDEEDIVAICRGLQLEEVADFNVDDKPEFDAWNLTKPMQSPEIFGIFSSGNIENPFYFIIIESSLGVNARFCQYIFLLKTSSAYPLTFLYPEGLREKLEDFFLKLDLDFEEAPRFSSKFRVVTENKMQLYQILQYKGLDDLATFPDLEVELRGNYCLFRNGYVQFETEKFVSLAKIMKKIF